MDTMLIIKELPGVVLPEASVTFAERLTAGGYNWVDKKITAERFPVTLPPGPRQLVLVYFDEAINSQRVEALATENGFEPALIDDLLAVCASENDQELQLTFPIVSLGSSAVVGGFSFVPRLYMSDEGRCLELFWYEDNWFADCRFLLRKKPT
jgi:hypothetical protein